MVTKVLLFLRVFPSNSGQVLKKILFNSGSNFSKFENKHPKKRKSKKNLENNDESISSSILRKKEGNKVYLKIFINAVLSYPHSDSRFSPFRQ